MEAVLDKMQRKGVVVPYNFTQDEFWEEIRKAEKGPFISLDELDRRLEEWKTELKAKR
jgi:Cdc6-like AAA superfamily ATPase